MFVCVSVLKREGVYELLMIYICEHVGVGEFTVVQIIILASARIVCNIVLCKCEVDPTGNCVAKINLYSN
jgi:hypothetical protein